MLIVTYCVEKEVVNCLESLRCLPVKFVKTIFVLHTIHMSKNRNDTLNLLVVFQDRNTFDTILF